jgi:enterochelin esterase-like enzyme
MYQLYGPQTLLHAQIDLCDSLLPVEFELYAPQVREVFLIGEMTRWRDEKLPMRRDTDGVWRVGLRLQRGQWFYKFEVDGEWIADPVNPLRSEDGIGYGNDHSFLFVGEGDWSTRPERPRGELFEVRIDSGVLGRTLPCSVYLPPSATRDAALPLLVLLHGHAIRANQWPTNGCMRAYMDNLLYENAISPFAVAMPAGHAEIDMSRYGGALVEELLPWLGRWLPVSSDARMRAIGGMSIAGYGPLALAIDHPEAFGFVAPINEIFADHVLAAASSLHAKPFGVELFCTVEGCAHPRYEQLSRVARMHGAQLRYMRVPGVPTWHYWNGLTRELLLSVDEQFRR